MAEQHPDALQTYALEVEGQLEVNRLRGAK
ncbi:hypothetical protein ACC741_36050 [Rhizobium johnstonii]